MFRGRISLRKQIRENNEDAPKTVELEEAYRETALESSTAQHFLKTKMFKRSTETFNFPRLCLTIISLYYRKS